MRFVSIALCLSFLALLEAQNENRLSAVENPYFEIVGEGIRSVSFVADLSAYLVESNASILEDTPPGFPQRILIVLRQPGELEFEGDYHITTTPGGFVRLDLVWSSELSLERCLQSINESYLTRYVLFNYGIEAPKRMKAWAVNALAAESYIGLRPAMVEEYKKTVMTTPQTSLPEMLRNNFQGKSSVLALRQAYPLTVGLRDTGIPLAVFSRLVSAGLRGESIEEALQGLVTSSDPEVEFLGLDQWWFHACSDFVLPDLEIFETMDVSHSWIQEMSDFSEVEEVEIPNLRALWTARESAVLKDLLSARLELIRLRLGSVNPAYFNTARGLGALYETILNDGRKHEFIFALSTFLGDFDDTKKLHLKVEQLLSSQ
ncbi:MAG: hypothetical protein AAGH40_09305 [Verrucomicrobiota bacterium]